MESNLARVVGAVALIAAGALALAAYRSGEMRAAAQTMIVDEFGDSAEAASLRELTTCGARSGEVGQYFVARVRPTGAPEGAYVNRALGIVYANWRGVTRVEEAGFAGGGSYGVASGVLACALPVADGLARESLADGCALPDVRDLNQELCATVLP